MTWTNSVIQGAEREARALRGRAEEAEARCAGTTGRWSASHGLRRPDGGPFPEAVHAALLPTGKLLLIAAGVGAPHTHLWDPMRPDEAPRSPESQPGDDLFCSGLALLSDGQLLATGPGADVARPGCAEARGWRFDPGGETWCATRGEVAARRWSPSLIPLGDRHVLVVGGCSGDAAPASEVYREGDDGFASVVSPTPPSRLDVGLRDHPALEVHGRGELVLTAVDLPGRRPVAIDPDFGRVGGCVDANTVLLPDESVYVGGGRWAPSPACWRYEVHTGKWQEQAPLPCPSELHTVALLLPTAQVLVVGWQTSRIEIFDPPYLARGPRPRLDAASVPRELRRGESFFVESEDAARIVRAVLVRPMAVTHPCDAEQRLVPLEVEREPGGREGTLQLWAPDEGPPDPIVPLGPWMLFLVDEDGVPSLGRFLRLR